MKIQLLCVGAVRDASISRCISNYASRIPHYWPFTIIDLPDVKTSAGSEKQREMEGEKILSTVAPGDFLMLLDERGRSYTSRELSTFIQKKAVELPRNLIFVVGGPYGFSKKVYDRADAMLSLSAMTFPHELVRLFMVEQLYRAGTIARGEPYHHD